MSFKLPIFDYLLLKLAARCNLDCHYCYWFRDKSVYEKPKVLAPDAEAALLTKLEEHIIQYRLKTFSVLFHGGEPLIFGKRRFVKLVDSLREIEARTGCAISLSITTNGVLIDEEWAIVFRAFGIHPTLSLDGPKEINDKARVDLAGRGTYDAVVRALGILRAHGIEPGLLAVCDPASDPERVARHFIDDLGFRGFDILVPDATHDQRPATIAPYYKRLFDLWHDDYSRRGVRIRYLHSMLTGLLGGEAHIESIGYGPIQTCAVMTDGALEPLDVLRITGYQATNTKLSILTHTFQDIIDEPVWREAYEAATGLCDTCNACEYRIACGGGFLPHRWSRENRYNNPSVYCDDLKSIFDHIWGRVSGEIVVRHNDERFPLTALMKEFDISEDRLARPTRQQK